MLGSVASKVMPGGKDKEPSEGWGKGRRNPIQLVADVGVPVREAYNQWTMLEEFPKFMHRVTDVEVDEDDRTKVKWGEKIWFSKRQWEAEITEMIPDERISWRSVSGTKHTGHVTFHPLEDNLTRVVVNLDFNPSGMIEKMGSGLRFVKRAAKSDVYRYKAFIETHEQATGAWRGRIEDGEVVEDAEVEEGKAFEEGQELRRPEGSGKQSDAKDKGGDDEDDQRGRSDEEDDPRDQDELRAQREERERRREERREEVGSAS
jgi:ribosome-associated toxin RatA of RatAB toxin-antitoxin module